MPPLVYENNKFTNAGTYTATVTADNGYTFVNWYYDPEYYTVKDFNTKVYSNLTLYAKWTENEVLRGTDANFIGFEKISLESDF